MFHNSSSTIEIVFTVYAQVLRLTARYILDYIVYFTKRTEWTFGEWISLTPVILVMYKVFTLDLMS
jgi:hypothetical protein